MGTRTEVELMEITKSSEASSPASKNQDTMLTNKYCRVTRSGRGHAARRRHPFPRKVTYFFFRVEFFHEIQRKAIGSRTDIKDPAIIEKFVLIPPAEDRKPEAIPKQHGSVGITGSRFRWWYVYLRPRKGTYCFCESII